METQSGFWGKLRPHIPRIKLAAKVIGGLILLFFLGMVIFVLAVRFGAFGALPKKADLASIKNHVASEVYSEDGVLLGKYFVENRTNVSLEAISPHVVDALIATEDARFYNHGGVDFWSLMRVLFKTILGGDESSGGGSTLSQQLAKNLFGRQHSMPVNKVREMFIAQRLEKVYSKKELLTLYLNTVSFGEDVYGIEVAAERFFNKEPHKLRIEEAAVLIGMLKAPTRYNPRLNPERARTRRNVVLEQMHANDKLSRKKTDSLKELPLEIDYHLISKNRGLAPYFREHIRPELEEWCETNTKPDGTPYNLYTDGLKIHTTINAKMQGYAEEAVSEHLAELQEAFNKEWSGEKPWGDDAVIERAKKKSRRYEALKKGGFSKKEIDKIFNTAIEMAVFDAKKGQVTKKMSPMDSLRYYYALLNAGFMVANPKNGEIKAWVGGTNYKYFQYDHVRSRRQVGSTFKPIVYAAALQKGFGPCDYFYNRLVTYTEYDDWQPRNSDNKYGGLMSMAGGLAGSVNSVTVDIMMKPDMIPSVIDLARQFGILNDIPEVPSIALGTASLSLYEMTQVYATLANGGVHTTPTYIVKIMDAQGNVLDDLALQREEGGLDTTRVLSEVEAGIMTSMLEGVVDRGTASRLRWKYGMTNDIAGKTGTTQSQADGWFMGYTPHLVAGAWVGAEDPKVHFKTTGQGQGANTALPIWARFMQKVHANPKFTRLLLDTFPSLPPDLAISDFDCSPQITDAEYIAMQNPQIAEEISSPDNSVPITDILEDIERAMEQRRNARKKPPKPASPDKARKDAEKRKKALERQRKRDARRKKTKKFLQDLFEK